jgi:hypothetical protein
MSRADVWMTPEELAREYHFPTAEAARKWARRKQLSRIKLRGADGRKIAYARSEVEQARRTRGPLPRLIDQRKVG